MLLRSQAHAYILFSQAVRGRPPRPHVLAGEVRGLPCAGPRSHLGSGGSGALSVALFSGSERSGTSKPDQLGSRAGRKRRLATSLDHLCRQVYGAAVSSTACSAILSCMRGGPRPVRQGRLRRGPRSYPAHRGGARPVGCGGPPARRRRVGRAARGRAALVGGWISVREHRSGVGRTSMARAARPQLPQSDGEVSARVEG